MFLLEYVAGGTRHLKIGLWLDGNDLGLAVESAVMQVHCMHRLV